MISKAADTTTGDLHWANWPAGEKPHLWINPPPKGTPRSNQGEEVHKATIHDARGRRDLTLDKVGFEPLYDHPTSLKYDDFNDESKVTTQYYSEVEEILKQTTGASRVFIFDHTIRRRPPPGVDVEDTPTTRQPVSRCHVDQTPKSGVERVHRHMGAEAEKLLQGRVRLINLWRPLNEAKDIPLAYADFNTVPIENLAASDLIYSPERIGETFVISHSEQIKWYYVSDMQPNEAALIKCFDSASIATPEAQAKRPGIAALSPHTAFVDDKYIGDDSVPRRESIEVRALLFG